MCSKFSTASPHHTQRSPTWKAAWARSSCHAPPGTALRAALWSFFLAGLQSQREPARQPPSSRTHDGSKTVGHQPQVADTATPAIRARKVKERWDEWKLYPHPKSSPTPCALKLLQSCVSSSQSEKDQSHSREITRALPNSVTRDRLGETNYAGATS
eukprot:4974152-Amphidinium_carterae.1